jgi:hypothetical protein
MKTLTKKLREAIASHDEYRVAAVQAAILARDEKCRAAFKADTVQWAEIERRRQDEEAAAPFGRCAFSGVSLPDPGSLSEVEAEILHGWAPCQIRYGRWPNGQRAV